MKRRARFWFDGDETKVEGWSDGETWNGFACPLFDEAQLAGLEAYIDAGGGRLKRVGEEVLTIEVPNDRCTADDVQDRITPDTYECEYLVDEHRDGKRYWRLDGLTWNEELVEE